MNSGNAKSKQMIIPIVPKSVRIARLNKEHRESRARRLLELESSKIAEHGYPMMPSAEFPSEDKLTYSNLEGSISRILSEARMSYVYGFFQAAVFQIGAIAELLIEQTLRVKEMWEKYESKYPPKARWLGTLVRFSEEENIMPEGTTRSLWRLNELRVDAVHMNTEKREYRTQPDEHPLVEMEDISVYEPGQIRGEAVLPGQAIILDLSNPAKPAFKTELTYKPQATEAFKLLSSVFLQIRELQKSETQQEP